MLGLFCWVVVCFGLASAVILKSLVALRRGEPYRFGFLDGGLLLSGKETSPRLMIGVAIAYAIGVGAILAWPLGVYEALGDASSACREIVPEDEVRALGGGAFGDPRSQELGTMCSFEMTTDDYAIFRVEVDGYTRADVPDDATAIDVGGARVWRAENGPVRHLLLEGEPNGHMEATLPVARFDDAATRRVAERMVASRDVLRAYGEAAWERPGATGTFLRNNAPWLFIALFVLSVVGAIAAMRIRQRRAMKRALEDDLD